MTVNHMPPQAYTKETLARAFEWLRHQNESVQKLATSSEALIGLYLREQRRGEGATTDRPSLQNFKSELKSLASMMGELSTDRPTPAQAPTQNPVPISQAPTSQASVPPVASPATSHNSSYAMPASSFATSASQIPEDSLSRLDGRTLEMIREVKAQFNLSSDSEALRMLVSIGFKQARTLWSKES